MIPPWFILKALEDNRQQHLKPLFAVNGVRTMRRHEESFSRMEQMLFSLKRNLAHAIQAEDKCVAIGFVRADFFPLFESEEGYIYCIILRQRLADNLPILIGDLLG